MYHFALGIEVSGKSRLTVAFAKYTLDKRKAMHADDHMKNQLKALLSPKQFSANFWGKLFCPAPPP